ncbi:hypothetical protein [Vibrio barjaei]|uniref:hypothetical protein n=1 Tax=Vibrio barjaei TaxID=1676683 RepID=UPI002284AA83|nr:hypothetical protein [Vibrio barjaei]MCY9873840.1 hypothetical protein [Vibrio barjaei]
MTKQQHALSRGLTRSLRLLAICYMIIATIVCGLTLDIAESGLKDFSAARYSLIVIMIFVTMLVMTLNSDIKIVQNKLSRTIDNV